MQSHDNIGDMGMLFLVAATYSLGSAAEDALSWLNILGGGTESLRSVSALKWNDARKDTE